MQTDIKENITVWILFPSGDQAVATTMNQGVRARYEYVGSVGNTLENLVKSESVSHRHATNCLVRLIRYA